ncbi:site-specific DNA-methyltransferase [Bartonella grahamii]|uniref:site-specific DNA-methyltransferase (adenine-specific) n=2 Tax=Bartonella grahamii TaxID=33045 RepID=A0A336NHH1_BARGR|nr:site-specific DNA-methyltransferase [Bartonella grahamii]ACS50743.1 type III restriction-modification system methylation subunit [Bartonella grahamii as4aup]SSZ40228.1 putative methyltransferase [Bartonella grahamii]
MSIIAGEDKIEGMSQSPVNPDIEKLKAAFPQCFAEGKLNIDQLLNLCGEYIDNDFEKFKFEWKGKGASLKLAQKPSFATLRPKREESVNFDNTHNLYIKGDNLEVLKLIQRAYFGQVKMIYIDPPYNTGNDFIYGDDFKDPLARYKEVTSQTTKSNPETMGRFHTAWLNMIYPRLRLAQTLLRDDGVIFISIDDHEVHNLRKVCDEVFGEENFVAQLVWNLSSGTQAGHFTRSHEYILVYARYKTALNYFKDLDGGVISDRAVKKISAANPASEVLFPKGSIQFEGTDAEFPDELGGSEKQYVVAGKLRFENGLLAEDVTIKAGWAMKNQLMSWLGGKETFDSKGQRVTRFYFNAQGRVCYEKERDTVHPKTVLPLEIGSTKKGSSELIQLLGAKLLEYPKPTALLEYLIKHICTSDNDIILDFFAGSSTTAHAVMALNAEDGGNRKFIMVQLPELCDEKSEAYKAGYKTICDIGSERIRRAGTQIKQKHEAELTSEQPLDTGFRVLELDSSNFSIWDDSPIDPNALDVKEQLQTRLDHILQGVNPERSHQDIIFEIILKYGWPLDLKIYPLPINGKKFYYIGESEGDVLVIIAIDPPFEPEDAEEMIKYLPVKIVALDAAFKSDEALINCDFIFKDNEVSFDKI